MKRCRYAKPNCIYKTTSIGETLIILFFSSLAEISKYNGKRWGWRDGTITSYMKKKKLINITQIKLRWLRGSVRHIRSCFTMCIWALWILAKIVVNVFSFQLILNNNLHRLRNCSAPWSIQNLGFALMATWYVFFDHTKKKILEFKFSKCVPRLFCYTLFFLSAKIKY